MYLSSLRVSLLTLIALLNAHLVAQTVPIPGKFYEYYTVASTQGGTFTALGTPSINDDGLCAFVGQTSIGQTIWISDGNQHPLRNINPGSGNPGTVFFDQQLQINTNNQVVARDRVSGSSSNVRIWDANSTDSFTYLARAGMGQQYNSTFPAPSLNQGGDAVLGAINLAGSTRLVEVSGGVSSNFAINTGTPQPVIAANGSMVITTTNHSTGLNQIILFQNGFTSQTTIASGTNFSFLDTAPGISDDGNVVVFEGTLTAAGAANLGNNATAGPGIFAAVNTGTAWQIIRVTGLMVESPLSTGNHDGVCNPGELCINAAELGYDDNNNPINFASYPTNSRVAVVNLGLGAAGIADDSFVISFVGTPSHAGRTNPVLKNRPLLFSNQIGLWTIRVDVEHQLIAPNALVFHPYTAIPVAQVGDQIGTGNVIQSIAVNQQIANAARDESGNIRTMRRGDHRVAFQATTTAGKQIIYRANHLNSDQDGVLDHWKTTGIDMDQDGVIDLDLAAMGATLGQRDLFVEMDWLSDQPTGGGVNPGVAFNFHPAPGVITATVGGPGLLPRMLATAPALSGNMYGVRSDGATPAPIPAGITMHIDGGTGTDVFSQPFSYNMGSGPLNGGDQIGMINNNAALVEVLYLGIQGSINVAGVNTRSFQDAKDHFFGSLDKDARELAFKYAILADHFDFDDSPPANHPISGAGANFILVGDAYPPGLTAGGFIKITTGTGAGQTLQVSSFDQVVTNKMYLVGNFTTIPNASSTFAYISGSSGVSEVYFNPSPDNNSLPGNDFMLTLGDWGVNPKGYLMNTCTQWRTLAHEMGHTLGLRHGGVDHKTPSTNPPVNPNYLSLMSYSHQLICNVTSPVQSYSTATDPVFDDFSNLNHQFAEVFFHVGDSSGKGYGSAAQFQSPEQNVADYIRQNGPIDLIDPTIAITAPAANSQVALGGSLAVTVQATDNVSVASVKVTFDANGDGTIQPTEIVTAQPAGGNSYTATFNTVSGNAGTRALKAVASDPSGNSAQTSINLNVGGQSSQTLSVSLSGTGSGTVTSNPAGINCGTTCNANFASGTSVTLTAAPATGSSFTGWTGACTGSGSCVVSMTAAKAVTATFTASTTTFALSVTKAGTGSGTVTSNPAGINCGTTCNANFASGTSVTLTAAPATGSSFTGWTGACTGSGSCVVSMTAAKAVTATFTASTTTFALSVTKAGTGSGTVTSNPAGINCGTTCNANFASGTSVTLTAAPATGSSFTGWTGACTGSGSCVVSMTAAKAVTATFTASTTTFALSVTKAGTGSGTVTSNPAGINCGTTCNANFASGTSVTLTAAPATGSSFTGWTGACTGSGSCLVSMTAAKAVTATFTASTTTFALSVTKAGTGSGTVTSNPVGINCGTTCSANYAPGTVVALTAAVASGSTFTGWSGACTGTGACSVTMSAAKSVTATFTKPTFVLSVTKAGTGSGTVTSNPVGINCGTTCSANYAPGTVVALTAAVASGSTFTGWSGACTGTGACSVTMTAAKSVTATFTKPTFVLSVTKAGTGSGTVTSNPVGINCGTTCSANYAPGTVVALTAAVASGSTFTGWSGACTGTGACSVTMSAAKSVTATFTKPTFVLSVTKAGTGSGTVTSNPVGINCGTTCSANYAPGTVVALTAAVASGSTFTGWSGACTGTGACSVTMTAAKSVTATFR